MSWAGNSAIDLVVVTERERHDSVATVLAHLKRSGYSLHVIPRASYQHINRLPMPEIIFVDMGSPEFRSGAMPSAIQAAWENVPMILLVEGDEVQRLTFGPSLYDFIRIPTTGSELDTRVRFALWKTQGSRQSRDTLQVEGGLKMNMATYEVWVEGRRIDLTYKEFELLKFFATRRRRVFTRSELLEQVWETDYYGGTRTVDVHIRRLRSKLGMKVGNMIQTVRNVGYRFG